MAIEEAKSLSFLSFITLLTICSGTNVGFSYDAGRNRGTSPLEETITILRKNQVLPSLMKISTTDQSTVLLPLANTGSGVEVHLYVNDTTVEILSDETSAIAWLNTNLVTYLPRVNITTIIFRIGKSVPGRSPLLSALTSTHSALKTLNLDDRVNISISFPLSSLQKSDKMQKKYLHRAVDCIRKWGSFVSLEAYDEGEASLSDQFIRLVMQKDISAASLHPFRDVPLVLNVIRSSVYPSAKQLAVFNEKMKKLVEQNTRKVNRFSWLFIEFNRDNKKQMLPSLRRQLAGSSYTFVHEIVNPPSTIFTPATPLTNPVTTPVTVPTGPFVTVPSNSPVTVLPTNPFTSPISIPPTFPVPPAAIPVTTPATVPPVTDPNPGTTPVTNPNPGTTPVTNPNPGTTPVTNPNPGTTPVTNPNPGTTPVTVPESPPITNPVTTYPFPPPGGIPVVTPVTTPVTFPGTPPATTPSPVASGQSWCVAKTGAPETALQVALDYACGIGGADCSSIQQGGPCYNPNTVHDHASCAFNSYYQKNPTTTSCDFGGTAMVTNINPSSGSCVYPSSSGSPGSPSSVLNTNNFTTTTSIFGSTPPGVTTSSSASSFRSSVALLALGTLLMLLMNEPHSTSCMSY